jgi:hypothetical protein
VVKSVNCVGSEPGLLSALVVVVFMVL